MCVHKESLNTVYRSHWFELVVPFPIADQLKKILEDYYSRMYSCEEQKWDLEREVRKKDWEVPTSIYMCSCLLFIWSHRYLWSYYLIFFDYTIELTDLIDIYYTMVESSYCSCTCLWQSYHHTHSKALLFSAQYFHCYF